jgi:hypothetical protein
MTTMEEEKEEVVVAAGEDKEKAEDKVGGSGVRSTSNNQPLRDRRRMCQWTGVGLMRGARRHGNQPGTRHERSGMRGSSAIRGGGAPVAGRRWHDE